MSFRNATLITATAFVALSAMGTLSTASAGNGSYGYQSQNSEETGHYMKTGMHEGGKKEAAVPAGDIVDVAVGAGSFNTLVTAIKAADLVDTLKGEGPFTVFAPTDEAFAKIPQADLDALLADKDKLTAVLTYHVVPGKVMAADVVKLDSAKTVQGDSVTIVVSDGGVKVDDANVVKTDVMASNGVIHVIDTVIMPN
ncbi:MAG: fasciclin domain-containing protein [Chromatiaceae bacterium]|jgi:uncharacterized surface protein with fasciclin (FAS1) repeats|nr:fasciclin domain-containing protein [Chromatiaceae bacterium]